MGTIVAKEWGNNFSQGRMEKCVLIIESDIPLRNNLAQHVRQEGFRVFEAAREGEAAELLAKEAIALVLLGLKGLKRKGIDLLRLIRQRFPEVKIITINSGEQFELSLEVMRLGAYDDFLIPFELETLMTRIHWALANSDGGSGRDKDEAGRAERLGGES